MEKANPTPSLAERAYFDWCDEQDQIRYSKLKADIIATTHTKHDVAGIVDALAPYQYDLDGTLESYARNYIRWLDTPSAEAVGHSKQAALLALLMSEAERTKKMPHAGGLGQAAIQAMWALPPAYYKD